jgi:hypothetical protein
MNSQPDYWKFDQVPNPRGLDAGNFGGKLITYSWDIGELESFNPYDSYLVMRLSLTKVNGDQLDNNDDVAINMYPMETIWQSIKQKIGGIEVDRILDYVPQVGALKNRMNNSASYEKSIGESFNFSQSNFFTRKAQNIIESSKTSEYSRPSPSYTSDLTVFPAGGDTLAWTQATLRFTIVDAAGGDLGFRDIAVGDYIIATVNALTAVTRVKEIQLVANQVLTLTVDLDFGANVAAGNGNFAGFNIRKMRPTAESNRTFKDIELIWKPPMGFYCDNTQNRWLPAGNYQLELNPWPINTWKKYIVESFNGGSVLGINFNVEVVNLLLYIKKGFHSQGVGNLNYSLSYNCIHAQSFHLTTISDVAKQFTVHPNAHSLTVAYQASSVGNDFDFSATKFKGEGGEELELTRFYLKRGSTMLPMTPEDIQYNEANGIDFYVQRYKETMDNTGNNNREGGNESLHEWRVGKGPYFHYVWPKSDMGSDRVDIHQQFSTAFTADLQVFLFDHYVQMVNVELREGRVYKVDVSV